MLEDINNILNAGEVPNLLRTEDMEEIGSALRPAMVAEGLTVTPAATLAYFTRRVRSRLHLVLAMSPLGEDFRRRLRMFPALVNCCTIDWFREWPLDALRSVARHFYGVRTFDHLGIDGMGITLPSELMLLQHVPSSGFMFQRHSCRCFLFLYEHAYQLLHCPEQDCRVQGTPMFQCFLGQ